MPKMVVKRIGILSSAKMYGLLMGIMGLVIGIIYGAIFGVVAVVSSTQSVAGGLGGAAIGLMMVVGMPIFYGALGFIFGALGSVVYNFLASFIGGIEMELENAEYDYGSPPPPPSQW